MSTPTITLSARDLDEIRASLYAAVLTLAMPAYDTPNGLTSHQNVRTALRLLSVRLDELVAQNARRAA